MSGSLEAWFAPGGGGSARLMVLLVATLCWAVPVRAQPSIWDAVADPTQAAACAAFRQVEEALATVAESADISGEGSGRWRAALARLSEHAEGPEPRVRFFLAHLLGALPGREKEVRALLRRALAEAPDSPLAADGWLELGIAAAKLGDRKLEYQAYCRALSRAWQPELRAHILYNRGDVNLVLGRLSHAATDFRAAASLAEDYETQALAYYGLGVTRERQGDLPAGLEAIRLASSLRHPVERISVLDRPTVFFVPDYDRYYYKALEAMAAAHYVETEKARQIELETAIVFWKRYLMFAAADRQPWVSNARLHLASCERQVAQHERRPGR